MLILRIVDDNDQFATSGVHAVFEACSTSDAYIVLLTKFLEVKYVLIAMPLSEEPSGQEACYVCYTITSPLSLRRMINRPIDAMS